MSDNKMTSEEQSLAQQQLIHSLLIAHHQSDASSDEQRFSKVMQGIAQQDNIQHLDKRFWQRLNPVAIAASLCLIAITFSLVLIPHKTAMAEVNQLITQLEQIGDRLYRISITPLSNEESRNRIASSDGSNYKKSAAKWLNNAALYMRNDSDYLLMYQTKHGMKLKANNQAGSWKIDSDYSYQQRTDNRASKLPLSGQAAEVALMDLHLLLDTLKANYQIHYQQAADDSLASITANKRAESKGIKQVRIYYHPDSYLIDKMVFEQAHLQGQPQKYRITLQLENNNDLAPDFFEMNYHLSGQ